MTEAPPTPAPRLLAIVPAHNEAASIAAVIGDLRLHVPDCRIVVIDDASCDATAAIAAGLGATVLRLPCNLGVGGAMQLGYQYADRAGCDIAIQFDGDGQHRANQIPALLADLLAGRSDLVVGSRVLEGVRFRFHPLRFVGSRLLSGLVSAIVGRRISDPTSGFRAAGRPALRLFARQYPQSYLADTTEALVWAARAGLRISEVPVRMRQREAGRSAATSLTGIAHVARIILALLVDCLKPSPTYPEDPA